MVTLLSILTTLAAVLGLGAALLEYLGKREERKTKAQEKLLSQKRANEALDDYVLETIALAMEDEPGSKERLIDCRHRLSMMIAMVDNLSEIKYESAKHAENAEGTVPLSLMPPGDGAITEKETDYEP